ncbi:hypothetical protein J2X65_002027 [Ancylobacter sp. 3268]|uniref:AAA family ATPase n=1 Tax=Ancylobacter sp. 3268 TaxID=2817752 RepID=UPI002865A0D8|nr:AAA family ATPase [Ancylobacter sp. 3268]MDR6952668.1 hypothetical protein [Ancylobacter sp. 3268]
MTIADFCCLKDASITLSPVNIIIGPQGSGKSVTTKLFYFFNDILSSFIQFAERGDSIEDYKKSLARQFTMWFPPSAWGSQRFNLNYTAASFSVRILRRKAAGKFADDVAITFSDWFTKYYSQTSELFDKYKAGEDLDSEAKSLLTESIDRVWRVRDVIIRQLNQKLEDEFLSEQTFIPAGRAFFTSIGRLVAGLEQAGNLDPVTIKFARIFANIRDRDSSRSSYRIARLGDEFIERRNVFMNLFFGGEIHYEDDIAYVLTEDGRKIPFSYLSSGQQEILPMWSLMQYFNELDQLRSPPNTRNVRRYRSLVYIEEPEAHLFPSAQSILMEFLIGSVASGRNRRSLIMTTHSPYIMSELNLFIKAGHLSRRKKRNQEINEIVPRSCWLHDGQFSAFAIENGRLRDIIDAEGLIDGGYLDDVSEVISRKFSELLRIESEMS